MSDGLALGLNAPKPRNILDLYIMMKRFKRGCLLLSACVAMTVVTSQAAFCQVATMEKESDLLGVLKSDSPKGDKALACKRLAVYGTAESAPELAKLLTDEQLASWARIALEAIPGAKVDEALRKATETLKGRLLVGTINSIGVRRDAGAVDVMVGRLKDKDVEVASAAAVALGRIGNAPATQALRNAIASSQEGVRSAVAEGCVLCAEKALADGNATLAASVYDDIRKADVPKQRVVEATRGAILARKQAGLPLLMESLRSNDKVLFQVALKTAREMAGSEVDGALATELTKATPDRAALVIQAMADRKGTVSLPAIVKAAGAGPKEVRLSAINALGRVGDTTCVAPLIAVASEQDPELIDAVLTALADLPDQSISSEILAQIPKSQGKVLAVLLAVVGKRRIEATALLVKATGDSDKAVRAAALKALGETVPADGLAVLISQVVAPTLAEDAEVAQLALKTAAVRMPDREACAAEIVKSLNIASVSTKVAILDILAAVGGTNALQAMNAAAKSDDAQLKDASTRLLGDWLTIDSAPVLLDLAKTGPADKFQLRAMKGYIRIARQFAMNPPERAAMCRNAIEAAKQPAEQKMVLEILKRYADVEMLKIAIKAVQVSELKEDAVQAAQAIAAKVGTEDAQKLLKEAGIASK